MNLKNMQNLTSYHAGNRSKFSTEAEETPQQTPINEVTSPTSPNGSTSIGKENFVFWGEVTTR